MKERAKRINYAEVDSDVDLDDQDQGVERRRTGSGGEDKEKKSGDTYGTTAGQRKKRKVTRGSKRQGSKSGEAEYDAKLLLELPFELFLEVGSHLDTFDLFALAKVNKTIRNHLLSKAARSVWSAGRHKLKFELPNGMKEVGFALMICSKKCQVCQKRAGDEKLNVFLRTRLCRGCLSTHTIRSKGLRKAWPDLHRLATQCVRYLDRAHWEEDKSRRRYLVSDLQLVDNELKELEEEDEIDASRLENLRYKASSTRSRASITSFGQEVQVNRVAEFVRGKEEWVKAQQEASAEVHHMFESRKYEKKRLEEVERRAAQARQKSLLQSLRVNHGWGQDETLYLSRRWRCQRKFGPEKSIEEDPQAWSDCRQRIRTELDESARQIIQLTASGQRQDLLRPYHDELERAENDQIRIFPTFWQFCYFESIRPLWEPEDAIVNHEVYARARSDVLEELEKFREEDRVKAIRCILAAKRGLKSTSSLSKDPANYPKSVYDNNFFDLMTSQFCLRDRDLGQHRRLIVNPYPLTIRDSQYYFSLDLGQRINPRQVAIFRSLVEAAGLDPETTTRADFRALEDAFVWVNDPRSTYRKSMIKRSWSALLDEALRKGPSARKVAQGARFEFEYRPTIDNEDQDSAGEDLGEVKEEEEDSEEEGDSEEEEEESDEEDDGENSQNEEKSEEE